MKILIDVAVEPAALAALQRTGPHTIDCLTPPGEALRPVDAERLRGVDVLFCTFPPENFAETPLVTCGPYEYATMPETEHVG